MNVELSEESKMASGCIANGFMKGDTYYWAMVSWKVTASGEVEIDIDKDFSSLAYGEDQTSDDPELIAYAKDYLKTLTDFQAQVWWVGDSSYESIDTSNAKILEAYIKSAAEGTTDPTEGTTSSKEEDTTSAPDGSIVYGDTDGSGAVDILDVIAVNKYLLGSMTLDADAKQRTDVDRNGEIDATDSLNILKFVVEMIGELPITE